MNRIFILAIALFLISGCKEEEQIQPMQTGEIREVSWGSGTYILCTDSCYVIFEQETGQILNIIDRYSSKGVKQ